MEKKQFSQLIEEYKAFILQNPIEATMFGIHGRDNILPEFCTAYFKQETESARKLLYNAEQIDTSELFFGETIDLDLIKLGLRKKIFMNELQYNGYYDFEQKPVAGTLLIDALLYLFLKDPRTAKIRIELIISRIEQIPKFLAKYAPTLKSIIPRWKSVEIEELEGITDLFSSIAVWTSDEYPEMSKTIEKAIQNAMTAVHKYISFLGTLPVHENFFIGTNNAQKLVYLNGIELTLEEIFSLARDFFHEFIPKKRDLAEKIRKKYSLPGTMPEKEILTFVKEKFSLPLEEIVDEYRSDQEKILRFLKETGYFVLPESHKLMIMKTPRYLVPTIPVGAMFPPAPFEKGPKTSAVYITVDEKRRIDQNSLMILNTMIHEGLPGHHMQFAVAYENSSDVRKLASYNTHAEGWTTYLEGFMSETGFIDSGIYTEYMLIALADFARLGARVAIDLFFLTGNERYLRVIDGFIPVGENVFDKAASLLIQATGFSKAHAEGELNWYSRERGYPMCYLIGNRLVLKLRNEVIEYAEEKDAALKLFHKTYLQEGIMPLGMLRSVLKEKGLLPDF